MGVKRGLLILLKIFVGIVLAIVAGSAAASLVLKASFMETLRILLTLGGIALIVVSGLVGAGFGEAQYYRSPLFIHSRSFQRTITRERIKRRDEQFQFMVVGFLMGLSLLGIVALLSLIPIQ
jgi:dihydrodipicolinate synthase/N-acetylneuraminate lyase